MNYLERKALTASACALSVWALAAASLPAASPRVAEEPEFTTEFHLAECHFSSRGRNPYFSLEPGYQLVLAGEDEEEELLVKITVLCRTRWVGFCIGDRYLRVMTRVVEEREYVDGELKEISRNYFARCTTTNAIYYFGEDVDIYEDGKVVSHDGAWLAGVDGALPGLIMPGTFLLGSRYFQELAEPVALDRAEHVAQGVDWGSFSDCVVVEETTPLEPGELSIKVYCRGIGLVQDDAIELVRYGFIGHRHGRRCH